jgi:hypothetical protein
LTQRILNQLESSVVKLGVRWGLEQRLLAIPKLIDNRWSLLFRNSNRFAALNLVAQIKSRGIDLDGPRGVHRCRNAEEADLLARSYIVP